MKNSRWGPCSAHVLLAWFATILLVSCSSLFRDQEKPATADETKPKLVDEFVVPLATTEPGQEATSADLAALTRWLAKAQIVGLGESRHGVHEFHRLAHRLFAHLARANEFSVFALEINQAHGRRLDDYVQGQRDDVDSLLTEFWWPTEHFYDRALRDLLIWMREYNETADHPVHVAGFDFKQPSFAMSSIVEHLRSLDASLAAKVESLYSSVLKLGGFGVFPNVYGFTGTKTIPLPSRAGIENLRAGAQIRARGISHGSAGLAVQFGNDWRWQTHSLKANELSTNWTPLDLELEVPDNAGEFRLVVFHRGNGTVWFDEFFVEVNGERSVIPEADIATVEVRPLLMPTLQVMDYQLQVEEVGGLDGGRALRVDCVRAVDEALEVLREVDGLLRDHLALHESELPSSELVWLRQLSRLVLQSAEWRTLVENSRDVFLAENVTWLQKSGFPDSRVFFIAHSGHSERAPGKMGQLLADDHGQRYSPVTMRALSGQYAYYGDVRIHKPGDDLKLFTFEAEDSSLERGLQSLGGEDMLFHLAATGESDRARDWFASVEPPPGSGADVVILIREVHPILTP